MYVNYEDRRIEYSLPDGWNVISGEDKPPVPGISDPLEEVRRALDHPIGSPKIEELARPGMKVVVLFDDLQRPTPADLILPEIMDRLNRAGVPDERIKAVCALGTHPVLSLEQMRLKVGEVAFSRLKGRLFCHEPQASDNVIIGKTHRGTLVEINQHAAAADLIIGIGECMPHPTAGYGAGSIDWPRIIGALQAVSYLGSYDLEIICRPEEIQQEYGEGHTLIDSISRQ